MTSNDMNNPVYAYSPIVERPRLEWPGGARVAFYVGLNIEHYYMDRPATSISPATIGSVPDPMNYGWRDYGPRVGLWRLIDLFDEVGVRPSAALNSEVCEHYPQIIQAGKERDWAWLAHGTCNSVLHTGMEVAQERQVLAGIADQIESATGTRPRGWLGPALTETFETPRLLRDLGFTYVLDWCCDDQPFPLAVPGMLSVPYATETNDITSFLSRGMQGAEYEQVVMDQLEQLLADGEQTGRVMALPVHPFVLGQSFRSKYLRRVLQRIVQTEGVWVATSDEIADYFSRVSGAGSPEAQDISAIATPATDVLTDVDGIS